MEKDQINIIERDQISDDKVIQNENRTFLKRVFKLFTSKLFLKQGIKFAIVGAIGTFVNLTILYLLTEIFGILYLISESIAFIISLLNNYILNKVETFKEDIKENPFKKGIKFALISIIALIVNLTALYILVEYIGIFYLLAELFAIFFAFFINFLGNRFWTFKTKKLIIKQETTLINKIIKIIIPIWLLSLGFVDIIIGIINLDLIFIFLGIPLIITGLILITRFFFNH